MLAGWGCNDAWLSGGPDDGGSGGSASTSTSTSTPTSTGGASSTAGQGGTGLSPGGSGGNEASVVSWNLREFPFTNATIDKATAILTSLAPDVVALQEISEPSAFYDLIDALPGYGGVLNQDEEGYLRLGLIYREERVTIDDVETLFVGDWFPFPRPPLKAHVTIEGDSTIDFTILVLHLKAQVDGESQQRRELACERLDEWVRDQLATEQEQDYLLVGDFNDRLLDPPASNVFDAFLDQPDLYQFLTLPLEQSGSYTYIPFQAMIDHVLVTSDALEEIGEGETEVLELDEFVSAYGSVSDHRPVRSHLSW